MIVVDTNTFSSVFKEDTSDSAEFRPVLDWVKKAQGTSFVYGGTKYRTELMKAHSVLVLFQEFRKIGKVSEINRELVDAYEKKLETINSGAAFNDKHLVAIIEISNCRLLCSKDEEAMSYIKNKDFYETVSPPKIYTGSRNRDLLNHTNIAKLRNVV
jgi:predicted nucleic acid-binding protein